MDEKGAICGKKGAILGKKDAILGKKKGAKLGLGPWRDILKGLLRNIHIEMGKLSVLIVLFKNEV